MHVETNLETEKPPTFADAAQASAEVDANRIEFLRDEVRVLERPMTDEEQIAKLAEWTDTQAAIDKLDGDIEAEATRHKASKKQLEGQRDEQAAQAKHLSRAIRDKTIEDDVPCRVEKVFATGVVRTVRIDTGDTVDEVAMEADERQADLFAPRTDAPESFSDLHEDESEPPRAITVEGEVIDIENDDAEGFGFHFAIALRNFGTRVNVKLTDDVLAGLDERGVDMSDHVELVGHYGGEGGEEIATFIASELRVIDPSTQIDATKMATVGDVVEAKKKNGKGRK